MALHGVAAACIVVVAPAALPAGIGILALGLFTAWSRGLLRSRSSVRALEIGGPSLTLELGSGEKVAAETSARRYVSRLMVSLPLRRPRRTILVTADMLPAAEFRRLRIWALWGRLPGVAAAQLPA